MVERKPEKNDSPRNLTVNLHNPRKPVRFSRDYYEYFMTIYGHEIFEGMPKATRKDTCVLSGSLTVNGHKI